MLIYSSSYKNFEILGIVNYIEDLESVIQVANELSGHKHNKLHLSKIHDVTKEELDTLLMHLKTIAKKTNLKISAEIESNEESLTITFNPKSVKGSISIHYGELYLLARAVSHQDPVLCDDENVYRVNELLNGICGIELKAFRTIEYLYNKFLENEISAIDFIKYFKKMGELKLIHFKYPSDDMKDVSIANTLIDFMCELATK